MNTPPKSALAAMIDKIEELKPVLGADVLSDAETNNYYKSFKKNDNSPVTLNSRHTEQVIEIDPNVIKNWEFHDRTCSEYGDLEAFAMELKNIGQVQPCIVRVCENDLLHKFEVIVGERRWRAAKIAGIKLKAIVKNLNNYDSALCQAVENSNRKDISEYSKGINYAKLVEKNIITQKDLQIKLKISQSSIRNLLSFSKIDKEIENAIGDMTKLSSSTAYEITRLQSKGREHLLALVEISEKIRSGKIGHTKLTLLIEDIVTKDKKEDNKKATAVVSKNGRHLFSWRKDSNGHRSVTFPKSVRNLINYEVLEKNLLEEIQRQLKTIENESLA